MNISFIYDTRLTIDTLNSFGQGIPELSVDVEYPAYIPFDFAMLREHKAQGGLFYDLLISEDRAIRGVPAHLFVIHGASEI